MVRNYKRTTDRGKWSAENLKLAINAVKSGFETIRGAARDNGIPERTLRRHISANNEIKKCLGKKPELGAEVETKLALHAIKLQKSGFALTEKVLRQLAYRLAVKLKKKTTFGKNKARKLAGKDWFKGFMRRNPNLSLRKAQGISLARAEGMNRQEVDAYFKLLKEVLQKNNLMEKPGSIFNMDETGVQLNNEPGAVVAEKGTKSVHVLSSSERGETVTVVACANAEGVFLPPYCIMKGVNKKDEYKDGLPPGSTIKMNKKSAYMNSDLFTDWLCEHFIPRKPPGKVLLILDGHSSHMNSVGMLDLAEENGVILLCLPSHTTHYLQPMDRGIFGPFKLFWREACNDFKTANPSRRINRLQFGHLVASAWKKAATLENGVSCFSATGIFPFNPRKIPAEAFLTCNSINAPLTIKNSKNQLSTSVTPKSDCSSTSPSSSRSSEKSETTSPSSTVHPPSTSTISPTVVINSFAPVQTIECETKRRKQHAVELTNPQERLRRRLFAESKELREKPNKRKPKRQELQEV